MPPLFVITALCLFHHTQGGPIQANACGSIQTVHLDKYSGTIELMFEPKLNGTDGNVTWMYNNGGGWETERTFYERIENTQFIAQFHVNIDSTRHNFHAEFTYSTEKCLSSLLTVTMAVELQRPVFNNIKDLANCSSCLLGKEQDYLRIECFINTESIFVRVDLYVGGTKLKSSVTHGHYIGYIFLSASHHMQEVKCEVFHSKHNVTLVATTHIYIEVPPTNVLLTVEEQRVNAPFNAWCTTQGGRPPPNVVMQVRGVIQDLSPFIHSTHDPHTDTYNTSAQILIVNIQWNRHILQCCVNHIAFQEPLCQRQKLRFFDVEVNITSNTISLAENDSLTISCTLSHYANVNISWIGPTNVTKICGNKTACLTFQHFQSDQAGEYKCIANSNSSIIAEKAINVTVQDMNGDVDHAVQYELNIELLAITIGFLVGILAISVICSIALAKKYKRITYGTTATSRRHHSDIVRDQSLPDQFEADNPLPLVIEGNASGVQQQVEQVAASHPPREMVYADLDLDGVREPTPVVRTSRSDYADIDFTGKVVQKIDNEVYDVDSVNNTQSD